MKKTLLIAVAALVMASLAHAEGTAPSTTANDAAGTTPTAAAPAHKAKSSKVAQAGAGSHHGKKSKKAPKAE